MKTPDIFEDNLEPVHAPDPDVLLLQEYMTCHRAEYAYNFRLSKKTSNSSALTPIGHTNTPFSINLSEFTSINSSANAQGISANAQGTSANVQGTSEKSSEKPSEKSETDSSANAQGTSVNTQGTAQRTSATSGGKKTIEYVSNYEPFNLIKVGEVDSEKVYAIDIKDPWIFIKIEQIINSYEFVVVSIDKYNAVIYANKFMRNENPSTILYRNYLQIYYFLRINLQKQTYIYNSFA